MTYETNYGKQWLSTSKALDWPCKASDRPSKASRLSSATNLPQSCPPMPQTCPPNWTASNAQIGPMRPQLTVRFHRSSAPPRHEVLLTIQCCDCFLVSISATGNKRLKGLASFLPPHPPLPRKTEATKMEELPVVQLSAPDAISKRIRLIYSTACTCLLFYIT